MGKARNLGWSGSSSGSTRVFSLSFRFKFTFILALVGFVFSIKGESIDTICEKARERKYNNIIKEIQDSELEIAVDTNENL